MASEKDDTHSTPSRVLSGSSHVLLPGEWRVSTDNEAMTLVLDQEQPGKLDVNETNVTLAKGQDVLFEEDLSGASDLRKSSSALKFPEMPGGSTGGELELGTDRLRL